MRLLKLFVAIVLCISLSVVAFAHPGRTDSKGGHMNHSTGEYHYHHGYSAHQHYDMDGDGSLDCPYNFKNGSAYSSASKSTIKGANKETNNVKTTESQIKKKDYSWIIVVLCYGLIFVPWFIDDARRKKKKKKK